MYHRCINPVSTGLCRPVRAVSVRAPITPARSLRFGGFRHGPTRPGTSVFRLWEQEAESSKQRDKGVVRVDGLDTVTGKHKPEQLGTYKSQRSALAAPRQMKTENAVTDKGAVRGELARAPVRRRPNRHQAEGSGVIRLGDPTHRSVLMSSSAIGSRRHESEVWCCVPSPLVR